MNIDSKPSKLAIGWMFLRISLAVILILTIVFWGGNWIFAKELMPSPWHYKTMLNGIWMDGIFAGLLLGKNWRQRLLGALIGLTSAYAYMNLVAFINYKIYA
jgi:hypothetical protein